MKEKIKITREELLEILGVTNNNLKTIIKRKQLNVRLKEKGYTYIDKEKVGRNTLYILEKCDPVERINPSYLIIKNFNVDYSKRNNKGIYYIIKDNDIYIGSTVNFRKRFIQHWNGESKDMKHTYNLLHNGGTFNILYDMTDIEDIELIRMVENEYIQYFKTRTNFNVINLMNGANWKGKNHKQKYKNIKIKIEDYKLALKILKEQGICIKED